MGRRPQKDKALRLLTVQGFMIKGEEQASLTLRGEWFERAGFAKGSTVLAAVSHNRIILSVIDTEALDVEEKE